MSFFDKLKKSIEAEDFEEEKSPKRKKEKPEEKEETGETKQEEKELPVQTEDLTEDEKEVKKSPAKKTWSKSLLKQKSEGELAIDMYETGENFVIQSTIAGINVKDLEILFENGIINIKGNRTRPEENGEKKYLYQECYWGHFSRQLILPEDIDESKIEAKMKEGILTLKLPKIQKKSRMKKIIIQEG